MDKYKKLNAYLRAAIGEMPVPLLVAEVVAVQETTCTVRVGDLDIEDVRLRPNPEETAGKALVFPAVGTNVLIGSLDGALGDLCVVKADVAERFKYEFDGLQIEVDGPAGKVKVANATTGFLELLQDLISLIRNLKVNTPVGPSVGILPDTELALQAFEMKFKTLFK